MNLSQLIKSSGKYDFVNDQQEFKKRILLVQSVVKKNAAVIVPSKNLNL